MIELSGVTRYFNEVDVFMDDLFDFLQADHVVREPINELSMMTHVLSILTISLQNIPLYFQYFRLFVISQ